MTAFTETRIRILGNRILIKSVPQPQQTSGGILLPNAFNDVSNVHEVLAVGTGRKLPSGERVPIELQPGDKVVLATHWQPAHEFEDGSKIVEADYVAATY